VVLYHKSDIKWMGESEEEYEALIRLLYGYEALTLRYVTA